MKISTPWILGAVLVSAVTLAPKGAMANQTVTTQKGNSWSGQMQELYKTLVDVLTDVTSDRRFNDPANASRIQKEADKLSGLVHDLTAKNMNSVDGDPTIQIVAGMLGEETKQAALELKRDNRAYARMILLSVPSYCIACHTRNASGPQFAQLPFEPNSKSLNPLERGEFFAASRQFDRAQDEFNKIIKNSQMAETSSWNWRKAVQFSLSIAVRVKKDPVQAQEIVKAILDTPSAPFSLKEDAKAWQTSITEWEQEPPHRASTEEGLYAETIRLMAKARDIQKYPMDRTADILYLRASAAVHDLLQAAPQGKHANEALYLAGLSYEVLSPLKMEDLHEVFYEACVRKAPHTSTAELCYRRLEASVINGYTGSVGTDLPEDVRQRLSKLRTLSELMLNIQK